MVTPIMLRKFSFKRSMLDHLDILTGLDRGCSLTKIIYVDKNDAEKLNKASNDLYVPLTVVLFPNSEFDEALFWLRDHALFPESKEPKFHVTGAGGVKYSEQITKVLEREVIFVDEFMSQSRGAYYLLKNVPIDEMTFPSTPCEDEDVLTIPGFSNVKEQFKEIVGEIPEIETEDDKYLPCIFGFLGSGGAFTFIDKDGKFRMSSGLPAAGKTFVGLSRCIVGTNNYKEITDMAARGNRNNVDTQIKDIFKSDIPHGFPPNLPIFHFGKLAETKQSINDFKKEDIARSLVSMFAFNTLTAAVHVCMAEKVRNVFLGGNLYQAEIFRKEFSSLQKAFGIDFINIYFVNNGHTGALGAMISLADDMDKFFHV